MNNKPQTQCYKFVVVLVFALICVSIAVFNGCRDIMSNVFYIDSGEFSRRKTNCEESLVGDTITKKIYGIKITATYKETIYTPSTDITERKYTVTNVERNGVSEEFAEDNYITVDLKGDLLKVSLEHIMDTEINAYEPNGNDTGMGSVRFNKTNEEIRTIAEKLLGDIVDWSMFTKFDIDLRSPTAPVWDDDHARNKTFAYLYWGEYQGGKQTNREFGCILEFASINDDSTIRTFYDKAYIRYFSIVTPFGKIDNLSKYIERIPKYEVFNDYYVSWIKEESGRDPYKFDRKIYGKGRITVYNGKICYCVLTQIYDPAVENSAESVYIIIPLE